MRRGLRSVAATTVGATLGLLQPGCSTQPHVEAMVVNDVPVAAPHAAMTVRMGVGPAVTVGLGVDLPPALLCSAIEKSLRGSAAGASTARDSATVLNVTLHDLSRAGSWDISVDAISVWKKTDAPGWQHTAAGSGTATLGEAIWGPTRLRLATERAAQAMIRDGLDALRRHAADAATR